MSTEKLFDGEGITSSERYVYTPSAFARKHLCYVQELGSLKSLKPHASVRENLESFLFFVVRAGSGCVRYEGKEIELKSGDAVLLDCREHYEHESSVNNPWELSWVHFDGARAEAVYGLFKKENGGQPRIVLGRREEAVSRLLEHLMEGKGENSLRAELKADDIGFVHILSSFSVTFPKGSAYNNEGNTGCGIAFMTYCNATMFMRSFPLLSMFITP